MRKDSFKEQNQESPLYQYINSMLVSKGYDVEFVRLPGKRGKIEVNKGTIDLLLPFEEESDLIKKLSLPIFHSMPGLCFKKENFIPILSATHRFADLIIGVPSGASVVSALKNSEALLLDLKGDDAINRGIDLTQRGRIDAFYHPSPIKVYHLKNKLYKEVACSYFHGYSTGVYIAVSASMSEEKLKIIEQMFKEIMSELSYEYYFANK